MKKLVLLLCGLALSLISLSPAQQPSPRGWGGAAWVWDQPDAHQIAQSNDPRFLRRTFNLSAKVSKADLWITADNVYVVYVNGQKVGQDSKWNTVEKYDVAKYLAPGKNVLAIEARNQGGPAGVIARLHVRTADRKDDYLIESVLYPSKVIKTGFESETVVTKEGKVLAGLVKDEGKFLRVLNLDRDERIAKSDVERRSVSRVSIMPEGQEAQLSRREFADLIAYLMTLR